MNEKEPLHVAAEAFDTALAATVNTEFHRLMKDCANMQDAPNKVRSAKTKLEDKFRSLEIPEYEDKWVALRYIILYQARQVNLIQAVLRGSAPESHSEILNVVDVGSGAWASLIAYAIYCFVEQRWDPKTVTHFHMIEPSGHMTQLGETLWLEFGRAAKDMRLKDLQDIIETISVKHHTSFDNGYVPNMRSDPNTELWILSAHALYGYGGPYDQWKGKIYEEKLPTNYHKLNRKYLKYEMITSDGSKEHLVYELVPPRCRPDSAGYLGVSEGKLYGEYEFSFQNLLIINKANLGSPTILKKTTNMVRKLNLHDFDVNWSWNANPVNGDAIWVWNAPE